MTTEQTAKIKWRASWRRTREHWRMMKRYGRWDGRSQWLSEFNPKPDWQIRIIGKSGKVLKTIYRGYITHEETRRFIREDVAAYWSTVKKNLTDGQSATITLNGRVTRRFSAKKLRKN